MSKMRFWVDQVPRGSGAVRSGPEEVCRNGHEESADFKGGPCSEFPCTCEVEGLCLSCGSGPGPHVADRSPLRGWRRVP